jgi:hypothetical protein
MLALIKPMRCIYGLRKCEYENVHILKELNGRSMIAVANHIKPRNKFLSFLSMPYDAFMIRHMLKKHGIYGTAMTSYDVASRKKGVKASSKEPLMKGMIQSMDLIPVNRKESDPKTIKEMKRRLDKGNIAIGMFPEGTYFRGFRKNRKLHGGMAILSKRYNLPILPIYIDSYNMNRPSRISIGNPIWEPMDAHLVTEYIAKEFLRLKERRTVEIEEEQLLNVDTLITK